MCCKASAKLHLFTEATDSIGGMQAFLEHIDILVFVEATIYQMDEENEALAKLGDIAEGHQLQGKLAACSCIALRCTTWSTFAILSSWHPSACCSADVATHDELR